MPEQCPGQLALPLWSALHPCPVCETDRLALGHFWDRQPTVAPYGMDELVRHLGACPLSQTDDLWVDCFTET